MLDAILSGATGLLNYFSQQKSQKQAQQLAQQQMAMQYEFAKNGISWKVQDSLNAGIHPLVGLGASTASPSGVSVGGEAPQLNLGNMGQDISRALKASQTDEAREEIDARKIRQNQIEKGSLENELLRTELVSLRRRAMQGGQLGPQMPLSGPRQSTMANVPLPQPGPVRTLSEGVPVGEDDIKQKAEDYPATKVVRPFGYPLYSNPWFNDGQQFEDRYGDSELGSTIKFGVNTLADHAYTAYRLWPTPAKKSPGYYSKHWRYK